MAASETKVIIAMLLDLVTYISVFGISVILFPILKKYNERIAIWYVGSTLGGIIIMLPKGLNEIFLGVWLIIKRFNVSSDNQYVRKE